MAKVHAFIHPNTIRITLYLSNILIN